LNDGCKSRLTQGPGPARPSSKDRSKSSHKALANLQNNSSLNSTKAPKSIELNQLKLARFEKLRAMKPKTASSSNNSSKPPSHSLWFLMPRSKSLTSMYKVQLDRRGTFNEYGLNLLRSRKQTTPQSAGKTRPSATVKKRSPVAFKPQPDCHNIAIGSEQQLPASVDRRKSSKCSLKRKSHAIESKMQTMKCSFDEVNKYVHSIKEERNVLMGILRDMLLKNESNLEQLSPIKQTT